MATPSYTESLNRFLAEKEAQATERHRLLTERLIQATRLLVQQFPSITRVVIIGSFRTPLLFRTDSDIDVVVSGLPKEQYFEALFVLEQELKVAVDIIREEEIPDSLRQRLKNALVLYGDQNL